MASFGAQLQAVAEKNEQKLEDVDRAFKLQLFGMVVRNTRVDTGRLRGNWQVTTGAPSTAKIERFQQSGGLQATEAAKIQPFSVTYLTNNLPYAPVWNEKDAIIGRAIADARRQLERAVKNER